LPSERPDWKRLHEAAIFEQFCTAEALTPIVGGIEQPEPPAPDLIADLGSLGRIAFELVRLNDPEQLTRMALMSRTPAFLDRAFARLQHDIQTRLAEKYVDGIITIEFKGAVDFAQRRTALPFVWAVLDALPNGFRGKVDLWNRGAPSALQLIWVSRGVTGGRPWFKPQTSGYVLPACAKRIAEKLQKRYECREPLELLAYVDFGELAHLSAPDEITAIVNQHLPGSQFRRVWIYEGLLRHVALRFSA
jgi:hypothetical protein